MSKKVKKSLVLILIALALCAGTVTGCTYLTPKKRYSMELQVTCPDGKKIVQPVPEIMLAGGQNGW